MMEKRGKSRCHASLNPRGHDFLFLSLLQKTTGEASQSYSKLPHICFRVEFDINQAKKKKEQRRVVVFETY